MTAVPSGSVVVGLDQSPGAKAALEWAAVEAQTREAPLRIASSWNSLDHEIPDAFQQNITEPEYRAAAAFQDETATDVRTRLPHLDIATVLMAEAPAEGLIALAEHAGLLVVGRRARNPLLTMVLGSVSQSLVAHSPVPVAVVPEKSRPTAARAPVVVGVAPGVPEPLAFAFEEAESRGTLLIAVRAWAISNPYLATNAAVAKEVQAEEDKELASLLDSAGLGHPTVEATTSLAFAPPETAVTQVATSSGGALVVLGRHRRHTRYGLPLGRVTHRVLHLSDVPVIVVPN